MGCRPQGIRILGDLLAEGKAGIALFPKCLKTWFTLGFGKELGMAARHCDSAALERDSGFSGEHRWPTGCCRLPSIPDLQAQQRKNASRLMDGSYSGPSLEAGRQGS